MRTLRETLLDRGGHSFLVKKGREMLAVMGLVPKTLQATVDAAVNTRKQHGYSHGRVC